MPRQPKDPLAHLLARHRIDQGQYRAAMEFRRCVVAAKNGDRHNAGTMLCRCYDSLGADGAAIVADAVIHGRSVKQIAELRGMAGEERYVTKRLYECLSCLAETLGFVSEAVTQPLAPPPASPPRAR
jgi:hypothetical protein